jgi:hypothetical protein
MKNRRPAAQQRDSARLDVECVEGHCVRVKSFLMREDGFPLYYRVRDRDLVLGCRCSFEQPPLRGLFAIVEKAHWVP